MTWRDRRQNASFRGVPFFVESESAVKGRRVSVRRLAGQNGSRQQDLGRNEDSFSVDAFVWGDDFDSARAELEAALLEPGPGALVLPTRGELWARIVGEIVCEWHKDRGGYASIRFNVVVEDRTAGSLRSTADTSARVKKSAAALKAAAKSDFVNAYSVAGMPAKYLKTAANAVSAVTTRVRSVQNKIAGVLNQAENLSASIDDLNNTVDSLLNTSQALVNKITGVVDSVIGTADVHRNAIDRTTGLPVVTGSTFNLSQSVRVTSASGLDGLGDGEPEGANASLANQSAKNVRAIYRAARAYALARQAETYAGAPFDSATLAIDVLNRARDEIDALQEYSPSDDVFQSLADLRASLAEHLTQTAGNLPKTITHKPKQEVPALLVAHYLYGDARQEADLVARNRMSHPLFVDSEISIVEPD